MKVEIKYYTAQRPCVATFATDKWPQLSRFTHELSLDMLYFIVNVWNDLFDLLIG